MVREDSKSVIKEAEAEIVLFAEGGMVFVKMMRLSCKSCGAKLELTEDIDRFSCSHCGNEFMVERKGGVEVLKDVHESLQRIDKSSEAARDNTQVLADQVRLPKIKKKIAQLEEERDGINLRPMMVNPEYVEAVKKTDEIKAKANGISMVVMLVSVGILFAVNSFPFGYNKSIMFLYYLYLCQFEKYYKNGNYSDRPAIWVEAGLPTSLKWYQIEVGKLIIQDGSDNPDPKLKFNFLSWKIRLETQETCKNKKIKAIIHHGDYSPQRTQRTL